MKTFVMRFDANGVPRFADNNDKATFGLLLSAIRERLSNEKKDLLFTMTIDFYDKSISEKQVKLFDTLVGLVARETGNDHKTISESLTKNNSSENKLPQEMSHEQFQELLERSFIFCHDFLGLNITIDENNHFQIKRL